MIIHIMRLFGLVFLVLATCILTCDVKPNNEPFVQGDVMTLLNTTQNGQKFVIGDINSKDRLFVAKLKGTHYEMGKAFGQLFKDEIKTQLANFFSYYGDQVTFI